MKAAEYYMLGLFLFGCLLAQGYGQVLCQCNDTVCRNNATRNPPGQCCMWVDQPIDTDPASLEDPDGTPLGFHQLTLPGADSADMGPCVRFTFPDGSGTRYLTIPAVLPGVTTCIGVGQARNDPEPTCQQDVAYFCRPDLPRTVDVYFECGTGCPTGDFAGDFYYRPFFNITENNIEDFCDNFPQSIALPSSLRPTPPPPTVDIGIDTNAPGGAVRLASLYLPVVLLFALAAKLVAMC